MYSTFINLLQLDLQTYGYAIPFDSNLDLHFDFNMFSKINRKLNDRGMRNIFESSFIECEAFTVHENVNTVSPCREFFIENMYVQHQNIAGLLNNSDLLNIYIPELSSKQKVVDVICITEQIIMSGQEKILYTFFFILLGRIV